MKHYSVSVIIPVGLRESRAALCLERLCGLSPPVDEIILVCDGANQSARDAAASFGVRLVELERNLQALPGQLELPLGRLKTVRDPRKRNRFGFPGFSVQDFPEQIGSPVLDDDLCFEFQTGIESQILMSGTGITIATSMNTSTVGIQTETERQVG